MKKKLLALFVALIAVFSFSFVFSACEDKDSNGDVPNNEEANNGDNNEDSESENETQKTPEEPISGVVTMEQWDKATSAEALGNVTIYSKTEQRVDDDCLYDYFINKIDIAKQIFGIYVAPAIDELYNWMIISKEGDKEYIYENNEVELGSDTWYRYELQGIYSYWLDSLTTTNLMFGKMDDYDYNAEQDAYVLKEPKTVNQSTYDSTITYIYNTVVVKFKNGNLESIYVDAYSDDIYPPDRCYLKSEVKYYDYGTTYVELPTQYEELPTQYEEE